MRGVFYVLTAALCFFVANSAFAQAFSGQYSFAGGSAAVDAKPAGVDPQAFVRGTGLTSVSDPNAFSSTGYTTSAFPDTNDYVSFTINADSGNMFSLSQLTFDLSRDGNGPTKYAVTFSSTNASGGNVSGLLAFNGDIPASVDLSSSINGDDAFTNLTTVTFKIAGYAATDAGGTGTIDTVAFSGNFSAAPEPTTTLLFGAGMASLVAGRFRRRSASEPSLLAVLVSRARRVLTA